MQLSADEFRLWPPSPIFQFREREEENIDFLRVRCFESLKRNEDLHHLQFSFSRGLEFVTSSLNLIVNVLLNVVNAMEMNSIILISFFFFYEQERTVFVAKLLNKIFYFFILWSSDISETYHTFNVRKVFFKISLCKEEVQNHCCSCKAGKRICNRKVPLMYQAAHHGFRKIEKLKIFPKVPPKTFMPQERQYPRSAGIHPEADDNLIIWKPELKSEGDFRRKKRAIDGVESNLYNPIQNYPKWWTHKLISRKSQSWL